MQEIRNDINSSEDIKLLVDSFYSEVRNDDLIGIIFEKQIQDRWPVHLQKMYTFWETILLNQYTYSGKPFPPHALLPLSQIHFDRWLKIFAGTVDKYFYGPIAEEAKWRAERMATMFMSKLDYIKNNPDKPLLL